MPKYRKRPLIVDAEQFIFAGPNAHWPDGLVVISDGPFTADRPGGTLVVAYIKAPGTTISVHDGDWIITDVGGGRSPLHDSVFQATYEPVADQAEDEAEPEPDGGRITKPKRPEKR